MTDQLWQSLNLEAFRVLDLGGKDNRARSKLLHTCAIRLRDLEARLDAISVLSQLERCGKPRSKRGVETAATKTHRLARPRLRGSVVAGGSR